MQNPRQNRLELPQFYTNAQRVLSWPPVARAHLVDAVILGLRGMSLAEGRDASRWLSPLFSCIERDAVYFAVFSGTERIAMMRYALPAGSPDTELCETDAYRTALTEDTELVHRYKPAMDEALALLHAQVWRQAFRKQREREQSRGGGTPD